jgi:hypothetical protein
MDQDTRIANLEAEVAALHLFVIALTNGVTAGNTRRDFDSAYGVLRADLILAGFLESAKRLDTAVDAINNRSTSHLVR